MWALWTGGEAREGCWEGAGQGKMGCSVEGRFSELTRLVLDESFLLPEDCGKVLCSLQLSGWAWNLWSLELLTSGAARKWGVAGEEGLAGWTPALPRAPLTSCIPGAAGGGKGQARALG